MMFQKKAPPMPRVTLPKKHYSQVRIETAFTNCADGCGKCSIEESVPVLIIGEERGELIRQCKYIDDCKRMAKHLVKQNAGSED